MRPNLHSPVCVWQREERVWASANGRSPLGSGALAGDSDPDRPVVKKRE